jgi:phosphoribosylaminoimidazolecarboxamide formyltransferase/IMP cyclohydrolase
MNILVSVWDKTGLDNLYLGLNSKETRWYSTGGTAKHLEQLGANVIKVEDLTQFPEMMHGRVKTLHPKIFGGILARREHAEDIEATKKFEIPLFDLVVVNLYPFWEKIGKSVEEQVEFVDIGGPSLLRAAAKNHRHTLVLSDPADYKEFIEHYKNNTLSNEVRLNFAAKTFQRTAQYDSMISQEWLKKDFPTSISLMPQTPLRYGENPHQKAAWVGTPPWRYIQGKELSYNNLLDAEAAVFLTSELPETACSIIKHNNPCGVAIAKTSKEAFLKALSCDDKSAFGGIVSFNNDVDFETAEEISKIFFEVIIAPYFSPDAMTLLEKKKNLRLIEWQNPTANAYEFRNAMAGILIQEKDYLENIEFKKVTQKEIPKDLENELKFAWTVAKHVKSNAIVISSEQKAIGIGAGQMSRVDAIKIALEKAGNQGKVLASDAFLPFKDNIDLLKSSSIKAIVQPGGSIRDEEVIAACNELGIAMVFTGKRHFKH